ncbi:MAG: hypothetical protein ACK58T_09760 [Phycisphaerae bacterium]|jgi:hypothetical protein
MTLNVTDRLEGWTPGRLQAFGKAPLMLPHGYHAHELFSDEALAGLLGRLGRDDYYVNTMDIDTHDPRTRREGEIGGLDGAQVLEAVRRGRIWILILRPHLHDRRYEALLEEIYAGIAARVPGFRTTHRKLSILISSPRIQVYYHCDVPGQTLWQVRGVKRVMVYPNRAPYLPQDRLERIVTGRAHEISLDHDPAFDGDASVFDLEPGQMLHWPLNSPHRIINHDCVNVSFTTEHFTRDDRRMYHVNFANGVLREDFGMQGLSQATSAPWYWLKAGLVAGYKLTGLHKRAARVREAGFVVDPGAPGGFRDLAPEGPDRP